ncbi:larval cuticle protein 65Ag1-like [Belonocnema kinseyi]|uniref:larval cuticle protein 65Ag1-like n=1 Tax=Belonocnema kinseyi TaxID=2817044 RepID=UPI00143DAEA5|nr:larval cuticle protein 65Ag1-like [Belonocnema kinseyi]
MSIIAFAALVAFSVAAPARKKEEENVVVVKELLHDNIGLDSYQYHYGLSDGQKREESAKLYVIDEKHSALVVKGSYSWVDPATKQEYAVNYIADENGYRPIGSHIPSA